MSPGSATFRDLQLALQWQYEHLKGRNETDLHTYRSLCPQSVFTESDDFMHSVNVTDLTRHDGANYLLLRQSGAKPPSLSSFDSGFDGAGSGHLETGSGKTCQDGASRPKSSRLHVCEENMSSISEVLADEKSLQAPSIHIVPNASGDSVNFEITVKRSATLPKNPWLSLPVDDLENCYTVIISPSQQRATRSCDQLTQTSDTSMCDFQDQSTTEWSPIHNVLSSTVTDGGPGAETSENVPTLLWDSYDLHDLMHDSGSVVVGEPECEWDMKEHQELRAVEETLSRAAGILQEEESVLAQEEILDVLLESDNPDRFWPLWYKDCQFTTDMTSSDLAEAGVIGLEDDLASLRFGCDVLSQEGLKVVQSRSDTPSEPGSDPLLHLEPGNGGPDRSELLKEIASLKVLEEKIVEENLKIDELHRCESEERMSPQSLSEDRKSFHEKLKQEKKELEEMERSLSMELKKSKLKCPSRSRKTVTCSIMGKASALRKDDEALLINCRRSAEDLQVISQPWLEEPINQQPSDMTTDHHVQLKCSDPEASSNTECFNAATGSSASDCLNTPLNSEEEQNIDSSSISAALPSLMGDGVSRCDFVTKDLETSVTDVSSAQDPAVGEAKNHSDPVDMSEEKHMHLDPSDTLDTTKQSNEDPKVETLTSEEVSTPAFDPGGPAPLPRTSRLDKQINTDSEENASDAIDQTAFSTALASSVDSKPQELKNPPCRTSPRELENLNTNNNNLHTVDLGVGSEKVSEEPGRSECIRAEDQKPNASCDGLISMLEPCGTVKSNEMEVLCTDSSLRRSVFRSSIQQQITICTREMSDFQTPVVLDTGSSLVKAGFADQELPTTIFPTAIGLPKYEVTLLKLL